MLQKKEKQNVIVYVDFERTFEKDYAATLGLDLDKNKFIFLQPLDGETAFTILEEIVKSEEVGLIIWDSDTTTPTKSQLADVYGKASFGGNAKLFSEALRKFNPLLARTRTSMIIISQERDNIGALYGPDYKVTGGRAIKFYASNRSRITKTGYLKEKGVVTGIEMKVKNGKNKAGIPFRQAELTLMFEDGFDTSKEYIDFLILLNIIEQRGAYFKSDEFGFNFQGRVKLQEWLDSHPEEYATLKLRVNNALCGTTVLDEETEDVGEDEEEDIPEIPDIPEA
jgi:recombination protein RecA